MSDENLSASDGSEPGAEPLQARTPMATRRVTAAAHVARGTAGGCLTALVATGAMLLLVTTVVGDVGPEQSRALGRLVGFCFVPICAVSFAAGIAWARRTWIGALVSAGIVASAVVAGLAIAALPSLGARTARTHPPLDDAQRALPVPTQRGGTAFLVQPAIGLEMLAPAGLAPVVDQAAQAQIAAGIPHGTPGVAWMWTTEPPSDRALMVVVILSAPPETAAETSELFEGVVEGATESSAQQGITVVENERLGPLDHLIRGHSPATGSVIMRTLVYRHGDSLVMATISALGASAAELEPTVLSARGLP